MTEIVSVRFKNGGKEYYFNPNGIQLEEGQAVIIETAKGIECAICSKGNRMIDETELISPLRPVLRLATQSDLEQLEENRKKESKAFQICQEKIAEHGLEMKLIEVEYSFDGSKILFFFTADGRVDFRALVKDLASIFRTRIELRQIGVRDEAKMLGGLGICGRPFCCSSFLNDFHPVSIKMAKTQNLSLNPTKISGTCGRLMCCLKYEQDAYTDLLKRAPKLESLVETPEGVGVVKQVNLLRETCQVLLDSDPDEPRIFKNSELTIIRSGKGKRPAGYEKPEELDASATHTLRKEAPKQSKLCEQAGTEEEQPATLEKASRTRQRRTSEGKSASQAQSEAREQTTRRSRTSRTQQPAQQEPVAQSQDEKPSAQPDGESAEPRRPRSHYRKHRPHSRKSGEGGGQQQANSEPKAEN